MQSVVEMRKGSSEQGSGSYSLMSPTSVILWREPSGKRTPIESRRCFSIIARNYSKKDCHKNLISLDQVRQYLDEGNLLEMRDMDHSKGLFREATQFVPQNMALGWTDAWLKNFLRGRTFSVCVGGHSARRWKAECGSPLAGFQPTISLKSISNAASSLRNLCFQLMMAT